VKVLVVDDAAANRAILSALLKRAGYEVETAANVAEAERLFGEGRPDAVMTDLHLADGEDGVALARRLRALTDANTVRLALMTADASVPAETRELFDAVVEKPVSLDEINVFLEERST